MTLFGLALLMLAAVPAADVHRADLDGQAAARTR